MSLRARTVIARKLRRDATEVERKLWNALRNTGTEWKFRRQHPIGRRVVDFACPAARLAIELDGGQHAVREAEDAERTAELAQFGYRVIRFWNNQVNENIDGVMWQILQALDQCPPPHPDPLRPLGGGEGT